MGPAVRIPTYTGPRVSKKKPKPPKATLYVEIDPDLKERLEASAERNQRKIVGEVSIALEYYLSATEPKKPKGGE